MGVGAAKAERVHPHGQLAIGLQRQGLGDHLQVEVGECDVRVERLHANGSGHGTLGQAVQCLHQASHARGGFKVPEVAFHRADWQRVAGAARLAQRLADGAGFDRVSHSGTGAVGLQVVQLLGCDAGLGVGALEQRRLGLGIGQGQAGLAPVGVHRTGRHHRQNGISIGHCLVVVLEQEQPAAFGAGVTVAVFVERLAAPGARQHGRFGEDHETERVHVQADTARHGLVDITAEDGLARLVEGHQRRRAGGVDGHAWATQVVEKRQAVGRDTHGVAGRRGAIDGRQVLEQAVGLLDTGDAQVHATVAATQAGRLDPGVFEGFPAHFQQHALLRVHHRGFTRRDAEEASVESADITQGA